jgi:predicted Na+-dependent transporter
LRDLHRPRVPSRGLLVVAVFPMLVDVGLGFAGLHEISTTTRLITGSVFGALIPFVILPVALGAAIERTSSSSSFHQPKGTVDA